MQARDDTRRCPSVSQYDRTPEFQGQFASLNYQKVNVIISQGSLKCRGSMVFRQTMVFLETR